ncbi:uncharacterized protein LOC113359871 [Papaver somniferum]|uniref:uncharacterized protein LOC113359871 n=1 Tax=Papaver somniferum TaxID=3469 RepID=UPI000E6F5A65|nr:uncharacterized protein LOC113359871 [Papaver somniferum]
MEKISLYKRNISAVCPLCESQEETLQHLLIECDYANAIWPGMNINVHSLHSQQISVSRWIASWFSDSDTDDENLRWKTILINLVDFCLKEETQYLKGKNNIQPQQWTPPPTSHLKINIDASFDHNTKEIGIGLIIRDSAGSAKGIRGRYYHGGVDPEQTECLAMKHAILWAKELNLQFSNLLFEADCINVTSSTSKANFVVHWMNQSHVDEIKQLLSDFSSFSVNHVKRTANNVAHVIANKARTF